MSTNLTPLKALLGEKVGFGDGCDVGGEVEGIDVGCPLGEEVGCEDGFMVGLSVG